MATHSKNNRIAEALQQAIAHTDPIAYRMLNNSAIPQLAPTHADANHNLGLLAVNLGKSQLALPFLQKAIETSPHVSQFGITITTAQLNCRQLDAAQKTLTTARRHGRFSKDH